jgi:hypothetical protein
MQSKATTVAAYLAELPADRRAAIEILRKVIRDNLDAGFEEGMQYGMIGYFIPHSIYPPGYHCDPKQPLPFAGIASQKNHMSMYLGCVYGDEGKAARFKKAWAAAGKKLDMGKACIRFKRIENLALDVIADTIKNETAEGYIAYYEHAIKTSLGQSRKRPTNKAATKKATGKKQTAKKQTTKKAASKPTTKSAAKTAAKSAKAVPRTSVKKTAKKATKRK